jgi:hypothetical protein
LNDNLHTAALNDVLRDSDEFANWLMGECFKQPDVSAEAARKLAADLSIGRALNAVPAWRTAEVVHVMLTDDDPAVVMAARAVLRQRFANEFSGPVMQRVWAAQDAADEPVLMDDDVGCEFDGVVR